MGIIGYFKINFEETYLLKSTLSFLETKKYNKSKSQILENQKNLELENNQLELENNQLKLAKKFLEDFKEKM